MVPFYTTKITTAILALSLLTGRGIVGSVQAYDSMHETDNQGSVVETQEETGSPEATASTDSKKESKVSKIDVDGDTKVLATEEPTPTPTPEATADTSQSSSGNSNKANTSNSGSNSQSSSQSQQQSQPAQQPVQQSTPEPTPVPSTPEPEPEQGDGYYSDQKSCMAAARSIGAMNYSCSGPLDDGQWYLWWSK